MSTWGQIVEPVSRAAWNDGDELEAGDSLRWKNELQVKHKIDTFLILEGKELGGYKDSAPHVRLINSIPEINLKLFEDEKNSRITCFIERYDLMKSSKIVELLQDYLSDSCKVIAVLIKSLSEYRDPTMSASSCVIRSLSTTKYRPDFSYPQLEQPNIISGVSAGVLCLREHTDRDAAAYVCYLAHPDAAHAEELSTLLSRLGLRRVAASRSAVVDSNLYI